MEQVRTTFNDLMFLICSSLIEPMRDVNRGTKLPLGNAFNNEILPAVLLLYIEIKHGFLGFNEILL
jgi:hypothetical protein